MKTAFLRSARHFFDQNIWLRIAAIMTALIMWVIVVQENTSERKATLPGLAIEVTGWEELEAAGLVLSDNLAQILPQSVDVLLRGPKIDMEALNRENIKVVLDLARIKTEGTHSVSLEVQNAENVSAQIRGAGDFTLVAEERFKTTVPVKIEFTGEVAENYLADKDEFTSDPARLNIFGSSEDLAHIKSARVMVDLEGLTTGIESQYSYVFLDEFGEETVRYAVEAEHPSVIVTGPVYYTMPVNVALRPNALDNPDYMVNLAHYEYTAEISFDHVLVCGVKEELEAYFEKNDEVYLLAAVVDETTSTTKTQSVQSSGIPGMKKCIPDNVDVTYTITERLMYVDLSLLKIAVDNPPQDTIITIDPPYLDYAKFVIPITKAPLADRASIEAYVDLRSYGLGEHTVEVQLRQLKGNEAYDGIDFHKDVLFDRSVKVTIEFPPELEEVPLE